ncbi:MAG: serine protease [Peptococcaceae bacterium]|nr:MAG: serine protease [Peptococcaceae bacterium]
MEMIHSVLEPADEEQFFNNHDQEQGKKGERPVFIRIVAFFTFLIFAGFVFLTTWPGLTLPSLDFLIPSKRLGEDPSINQLKQYVVQINAVSRPERAIAAQISGTGFNIAPDGIIVTNRHIVSDALNITVAFSGGKTYPVKNIKTSPDLDLALIYLEARDLPAATINAEKRSGVGDEVIIIGNPLGIDNVIMEGTISAFISVSGFPAPVFVIDAPVHPGNSGSPVFDEDKKVAGIVFGSIQQKDGAKQQGAAIPAREILEFIGEN